MVNPASRKPRKAASRPSTCTFYSNSNFFHSLTDTSLCAFSAACFAAKGVFLRAPLNPHAPADDHAKTLPLLFVIVTMVLLKVIEYEQHLLLLFREIFSLSFFQFFLP